MTVQHASRAVPPIQSIWQPGFGSQRHLSFAEGACENQVRFAARAFGLFRGELLSRIGRIAEASGAMRQRFWG